MISLLWLFLIFVVEGGLLWGLYKFLGKAGIYAFGAFAIIQSVFQVFEILVGSISVIASLITWVLFLFAIIILIEKFGRKSGIAFLITMTVIMLAVILADNLFMLAAGIPYTFEEIWQIYGITFVALVVEGTLAIVLNKLFEKLPFMWRCIINLAILIIVDAFLFVTLLHVGNLAIGDIMALALKNLWQKAILGALLVPVFYAFAKTKVVELETLLTSKPKTEKVKAEKEETPAPIKAEKPAKKVEKKTTKTAKKVEKPAIKKPETAKKIEKPAVKKVEAKPAPAKKPAKPVAKKSTAKKPAKKTTKK